ncbi:RagB/SusD family nutrient uptake outer membrane protein [uncultured Draconibacterium sp.]|uniref:RagB/SusD family nutrient uptake outer membrane protein n=1 Tax=uncultured Draconibacterium sp. TaxID=1573823 RepID=UPI0025E4865B|nr:RagB/SusD family nutrient uptake outer membrane protein [uncultured Draconibacterium sp.]
MKRKIITKIGAAFMALFLVVGCTDILEEHPRNIYEPGFFQTETGVMGGLTSLYAHLRWIYGQAYYYNSCETGTDEYTWGQSADANFKDHDLSGEGQLTPSTSRSDVIWNALFTNINTASGIIENASGVGLSDALIGEATFFRAFDYFLLTQTFGGVPLDLGSGELKFNATPARVSVRNTVPEVYTKCVFPDLIYAVENLPTEPRLTGAVTKTTARLFLAKAYLTYGWWLENPNNIPTYPAADRVDPDGHNPQWYFQQAYDVAMAAINDPGPYGLQETYYDVNLAENDRNSEHLLYADRTEESEYYLDGSLTYASAAAPDNFAVWMVTCNIYVMNALDSNGDQVQSVWREAAQSYGRPWTRMAPPIEVFTETFADKTHDSRYDGTFVTSYRGNWNLDGAAPDVDVMYNANGLEVQPGDAILTFLDDDSQTPSYTGTFNNGGNMGGGELAGRSDYVIAPSGISRRSYPGLWKLGTYRTDNDGGLGEPNGALTRPFYVAKFSELYLVAAEAAVKGASGSMSARELINVLRARAGKWRWDNGANEEKVADYSAEMVAATPQTIDIDYVLEERSRELFGEGYRWYDLIRTQKWGEVAATFTICGSEVSDHTPVEYSREIADYHYLRPIPQGQLDALEMTDAEKAEYQNPGYN